MIQHRVWSAVFVTAVLAGCVGGDAVTSPGNSPIAQTVAFATGRDPITGARLNTGNGDMPGELVHVTGDLWGAGETVRLEMVEDPETHETAALEVSADGDGSFSIHYNDVQPHGPGVTFRLTATGLTSGSTVTVEFTDNTWYVFSTVPAPGPAASILRYPQSSSCDPLSASQTVTTGNVSTDVGISQFVGLGESARISVPNEIAGYAFSHWPVVGSYALVVVKGAEGGSLSSSTICVRSTANPVFTAVFEPAYGGTPPGPNVIVEPLDATTGQPAPVELTFEDVTGSGQTTVTSGTVGQGGGPPAPGGFRLGNPPTYYDVQTTATFSGAVTLCFDYSGANYGNENGLKLLHFEGGVWTDVTTSLDTEANLICGTVTSLSPFLVAEQNAAPVVTSLALPAGPVPVGTSVALGATFTDANPNDVHSAAISWDDGSTSAADVTEAAGTGEASASHTFTAPGVYTVVATVSDGDLDGSRSSSEGQPAYVVVFDPAEGFVTGGGWFNSPVGACRWSGCAADGSTVGRASFGFVSRYQRGANTPTGNTEFQFKAGSLAFHSSSYQWLVVAGSRAQYKGTGRIAGSAAPLGFLITAVDGALPGGLGQDRFRIKIWDVATGDIVYDNQIDQLEDSDAATAIGGGSIVIHR